MDSGHRFAQEQGRLGNCRPFLANITKLTDQRSDMGIVYLDFQKTKLLIVFVDTVQFQGLRDNMVSELSIKHEKVQVVPI